MTVDIAQEIVEADNAAREAQARRIDKIEEDVATLAGHIGEIRRALAEIAAGQQTQAQAAATLAGRVDAAEQAATAIRVTMSAEVAHFKQALASASELTLATRDMASKIIMQPRG